MGSEQGKSTFQVVNLVRTAAILPVLASHASGTLTAGQGVEALCWSWLGRNNVYGVSMFFVVSGFLITRVLAGGPGGLFRPNLRHFYVRRMGRILPLVFLFVGIGIIVLLYGQAIGGHIPDRFHSIWIWASIATFTFNWYEVAVNSQWFGLHWMVLWSLAVEEQFYVLYPIVLRRLGNLRNFILGMTVILCLGPLFRCWAYWFHPENYWLEAISTFSAMDQLAVGCLLFAAWERFRDILARQPAARWSLTLLGGGTLFVLFSKTSIYNPADLVWGPTLVAVGCFFFLLGGLSSPSFEVSWGRWWTLPGKFSYGIYLLHTTVLFLGYSFFYSKPAVWAFPLYLALCTLVAGFSFYFYETPMNRWVRRLWDPQSMMPTSNQHH